MPQLLPTMTMRDAAPVEQKALGGGLEGAEKFSRELMTWHPPLISPDALINPNKELADARGVDSVSNDGFALGAVQTHRDSIIGAQYRLNAQPDWEILGAPEGWAEEFQKYVESHFNLIADAPEAWFDAQRVNTLTGLLRLAVGGFVMTGEVLGTVEWIREQGRPFNTAIQMVSPSRLTNPNGESDNKFLRRGIKRDIYGRALGYHFRVSYPMDIFNNFDDYRWRYVPAEKPWGRRQVLHIVEQLQPDQTRGVAEMVSVLKQMRMTKRFQDVTLQNAVVNATYAAAIESELPREMVFGAMGAGQPGLAEGLGQYMAALAEYVKASENIQIDGVKMPHLFPGTKLSLKPMGTPGGIGTGFEESLQRHTAAALGLSYEEFARDFSKTNYSSARASMAGSWKYMQARKKTVADRMAHMIYTLWFEEKINRNEIPLWKGATSDIFYDPVMRQAMLAGTWIGASRGQIDEMKETQSAIMRIKAGLSTYEAECAQLGNDFRKVFHQAAREKRMIETLGLEFNMDATKPGANDRQQTMTDDDEAEAKDERATRLALLKAATNALEDKA